MEVRVNKPVQSFTLEDDATAVGVSCDPNLQDHRNAFGYVRNVRRDVGA